MRTLLLFTVCQDNDIAHDSSTEKCVREYRKHLIKAWLFVNIAHSLIRSNRVYASKPVRAHLLEPYLIKGDHPAPEDRALPTTAATSSFVLARNTKRRIWSQLTPARCCIAGAMYIQVGNALHLRRQVLFIDAGGDARPPDSVGTDAVVAPSLVK